MKKTIQKNDLLGLGWVAFVCALILTAFWVANAQTTTAISSQMGPGDSGSQVTALQQFLAADDSVYPSKLVTGYYGPLTTVAVQKYQCDQGIVCQGDVATTGYGRVGPATLAKLQEQEGISPGGGTTVPPISVPGTGADVWAPIINAPTVATSSTTATIDWTTNEPAHDSVMYGMAWPFLYASAPSAATATFGTAGQVTLTGLQPNTKYYYVLQSVDASGNLQWSIGHSFTTSG